jgi:hypothetical protein
LINEKILLEKKRGEKKKQNGGGKGKKFNAKATVVNLNSLSSLTS